MIQFKLRNLYVTLSNSRSLNMFRLSAKISHHYHILRCTASPINRTLLSTSHDATQSGTPKSISEIESGHGVPSKDDLNPTSKENTQSGTHDEIAHMNEAAYGSSTNPVEEKAMATAEVSIFQ